MLSRHRVTVGRESYADLQALCHSALPRRTRLYNEYHALLVRVGKEHCRARPACRDPHCPLLET